MWGVHVVVLLDRQDRRAEHAGDGGPAEHADGDEHVLDALAHDGEHRDDEQRVGNRQEHVGQAHDDRVEPATVERGERTHHQADVEMSVAMTPTVSETREP